MEENLYRELHSLGVEYFTTDDFKMELLKGDGSDRKLYRFTTDSRLNKSIVGVTSQNLEENQDFLFIGKKLKEAGIPTPAVYLVGGSKKVYLLQDLGPCNLAKS